MVHHHYLKKYLFIQFYQYSTCKLCFVLQYDTGACLIICGKYYQSFLHFSDLQLSCPTVQNLQYCLYCFLKMILQDCTVNN